jgi:hypothetical protein
MRREAITYIVIGGLNAALAFSVGLWLLLANHPIASMALASLSVWFVAEILATLVLRRPLVWRALCVLATAPWGLFVAFGAPTLLAAIMRGQTPPWVTHSPVAGLLVAELAVVCGAHGLAWRFLRPKSIPA